MQISQTLILKNFDSSIGSFVIKKSYFNTINLQFDTLSTPNTNGRFSRLCSGAEQVGFTQGLSSVGGVFN